MQWDWTRVNPRGGMTATMAKVLAAAMVLSGLSSASAAGDLEDGWRWLSVASAILCFSVAAWIVSVAAGVVRRP